MSVESGGAARAVAEGPAAEPRWAGLSDEELLGLRLCDLRLTIQHSPFLVARIRELGAELAARKLQFRPHFWLSSEWFTPDGVPGIAIPFYLAHPRLVRLEEKQMLEAEGGTPNWCMRILRHEAGHAIDNAYRLSRRKRWQQIFGKASQKYPESYQPKPFSRRFVLHLDAGYAQSHPSEDFAETFAVWLAPNSDWAVRYQGWPALKKLQYVDELMNEIAALPQPVKHKGPVEPLRSLRSTLGEHYEAKRALYGTDYPDFYDRDLRRLFSAAPDFGKNELAASFLRRNRREIRLLVSRWTGQYQYRVEQVLKEMIARCQQLKLRVSRPDDQTKLEAAILLTVQTMNYLHGGRYQIAL